MDYLDFSSVLIWLTAYFLVEFALKAVHAKLFPKLHDRLRVSRKDAQYFAFAMGILISTASAPICFRAVQESTPKNDAFGSPNFSSDGQICIASRSVLWVSELNRLDHSARYLYHHFFSLGYLLYHMQMQHPMRIIYALYASLATEVLSDSGCILTVLGYTPENSRWAYRAQVMNTIALLVLRIPPMMYASTFLPAYPLWSITFAMNAGFILFYARFIIGIVVGNMKRLKMFQMAPRQRGYVRIAQRIDVSIYCIFLSIASFVAAMLTRTLYCKISSNLVDGVEFSRLNQQLLFTGLSGFAGARVPGLMMKNLTKTPTLWIQGSTFGMASSILPGLFVDKYRLFVSMALALPIAESIGRIGCYYAGCCGYTKKRNAISLQLISVGLNGLLGSAVLSLVFFDLAEAETVATFALFGNVFIRLFLRPNVFAISQLIIVTAISYSTGTLRLLQPAAASSVPFFPGEKYNASRIIGEETDVFRKDLNGGIWTACLALASILAGGMIQICCGSPLLASDTHAGLSAAAVIDKSHKKPLSEVAATETPNSPSGQMSSVQRESNITNREEHILYLAYGSNLCATSFTKRRGIKPLSATIVLVPDLELTFDLPGIPYTEPCFANTKERSHSPPDFESDERCWNHGLVGVVYEITQDDLRLIMATEGGGASYKDVTVTCYPLQPGLQAVDSDCAGCPLEAHTLQAAMDDRSWGLASQIETP